MAKKQKLTAKQQKFISEYMVDLNATQAAIRSGYSQKTAGFIGHENLRKPIIQQAIEEFKSALSRQTDITIERCLREYGRLAFLDIRKAFDDDGNLKAIKDMDDDTAAAISGLEFEQLYEGKGEERENVGRLAKIKLNDKARALQDIMRHLGGFGKDALALTGKDGGPIATVDIDKLPADQKMQILKSMM